MSIHTILSQEIEKIEKKMNTGLNCPYCNAQNFNEQETDHVGDCLFLELKTILTPLATRIVEEVGKELIGEDELLPAANHDNDLADRNYYRNDLKAEQRTKLQKMKEI